jgi:hypothetical protein
MQAMVPAVPRIKRVTYVAVRTGPCGEAANGGNIQARSPAMPNAVPSMSHWICRRSSSRARRYRYTSMATITMMLRIVDP